MAEYNFWDDRTTEENDENYCPILDGHCSNMSKCDECEENAKFAEHFQLSEAMSLKRMSKEVPHDTN